MTTTKTAKMNVSEYRDLISCVSDHFASLRGVANATERVREAEYLRSAARELMAANCPRATDRDRQRAERMIDQTAEYLIRIA